MFEFNKDLEYSHSFLNSLHSSEQGEFAYYNIQLQLESAQKEVTDELIRSCKENIDQETIWLNQLWAGGALFMLSWKSPETEDAQRATTLLTEKRSNLIELSQELSRIVNTERFDELSPEDIQFAVAALGRHRYAQDNYFRGMLELSKALENKTEETKYNELLKKSDEDIQVLHEILKAYRGNKKQGINFFNALYAEIVTLSGTFRAQVHDMSQLLSVYSGPFNYELAGIPEDEAADWHALNIHAYEAGYWRAYYIGPEEVYQWKESGFTDYALAGSWRSWGFPHDVAALWVEQGFSPEEASLWANAEVSLKDACNYRELGINHPADIR